MNRKHLRFYRKDGKYYIKQWMGSWEPIITEFISRAKARAAFRGLLLQARRYGVS